MNRINETRSDPVGMSLVGRLLLTAALMFGFILALVYVYRLAVGGTTNQVIDLVFILFGTAVGGAVGVRVARMSWRETAFAALLSAISLIIFSRFVPSFPGPWVPGGPGSVLDLTTTLVFLAVDTAGMFFLPLFDPEIRRAGPAPSLGLVALVAVTLTVLAVLVDYLVGDGSFFGLLTLVFGSIAAGVLVGVGMILVLVNVPPLGAWLGGLALVLEIFVVIGWILLGRAWFP